MSAAQSARAMIDIPLPEISTVFLDAGNTLISMNYERVATELRALGYAATADAVQRAEAAARPASSRRIAQRPEAGSLAHFELHLSELLAHLAATALLGGSERAAAARALAASLKPPGQDYRLWSWVLPGVPAALAAMRGLGLKLVVVSNSDGSVERALRALGLTTHLAAVLDSHVVGFEKPDPRFFEHALGLAGAEPQRTVHVGDMYFQDVEGARAAGIHGVLLDPFGDWTGAECARMTGVPELAVRLQQNRSGNDV
jgi:HAD superfamily hydrolase (TIGR01509 family)